MTSHLPESADATEADGEDITFGMEEEFATVENEAELLKYWDNSWEQYAWCASI